MKKMICSFRGRGGASGVEDSWHNVLELGSGEYTNTITSVQKDNYVLETITDDDSPAGG